MSAVQLRQVAKRFGTTEVIRNVDLDINSGEFIVFIGASGSGKSTLLRMIAGLETPSAGRIVIDGEDVTDLPPSARGISMVFQSYALYPHMSVRENIGFGLQLARTGGETIAQKVAEAAQMLQITELLDRKPRQLSGGQRQRVAIARAIVRQPRVLLFDEPLSNLDAALRARTRLELADMHQRLGSTIIYVTHDQVEAMSLADRMVILNGGRIEQVGKPSELYHRPATRYVAAFLGSPAMNFLEPDRIADGHASLAGGGVIKLPPHAAGAAIAALGIRPEDIAIVDADAADDECISARIFRVEELGEVSIVHVRLLGGQELAIRRQHAGGPDAGPDIMLSIPASRLQLFDQHGKAIHFPKAAHAD
ncbi:ABC transporter ATP-binding protein [Sandarakinorhabdus sp.]|uniref:ABC transporter ATP-binding protein n=1 Tax=Sandarakinorhabdus sp. TaxID=1916663 RepID=UPI003F6ECBF1